MKSLRFLFLFVCVGFSQALAQETYQTVLSDPDIVYPGYLGINYLTVDAGFANTSGASIWSVGVDAMYPINEKLRLEALALYSLFSFEKEGLPFLLSTGAEYEISSRKKDKEIPVLLSFAWDKDYMNNKEIQTWEAVHLPGQIEYELVARGGLYLRNSALEYSEGTTTYDLTGLTHAGIYAGVGYNMKSYLQAQTSDGYKFAAGRLIRPYFDVLVLPTSADLEVDGTPTKTVEENVGWRAGVVIVTKPYTTEQNFGRKFGFFGNSIFRIDIGQRPLEGFFITTGVSYNLRKFK